MIEIRATETADLEGLSALFVNRFGHPLAAEEWQWKYRQLPGISRSVVAVDRDGLVLAHAGALCLAAHWRGGASALWQLVDFAGTARGGGLRPAFVDAGQRLLAEIPAGTEPTWIFGFPSERHLRLGERVFGYRRVMTIAPLAGPLADAAERRGTHPLDAHWLVESGDSAGDWATHAWRSCGVFGVDRSVAFLNWRYWARPGRYYRFYRLRSGDGSTLEGLAVFAFVGDEAWASELWLPPRGEWYAPMLAIAGDLQAAGLRLWRFWPPSAAMGSSPGFSSAADSARRDETADLPSSAESGATPLAALGSSAAVEFFASTALLLDRLGLRGDGDSRLVGCCRAGDGPDPGEAMVGFSLAMGDFDAT